MLHIYIYDISLLRVNVAHIVPHANSYYTKLPWQLGVYKLPTAWSVSDLKLRLNFMVVLEYIIL